jgi:hypothetical protein
MYVSQWNEDLFSWWVISLSLCAFFWLSLISATRQRGVIQLGRDRLSPGGKTGIHSTGGAGENVPVRIWDEKVTNYQTGRPIYVFEPMKWWSFFMMDDLLCMLSLCAFFWLSLIFATRQRGVFQLGRDRLSPGGKTGTHSTGGAGENFPVRNWDRMVTNYQTGCPIYVCEPMKWWSFFMMSYFAFFVRFFLAFTHFCYQTERCNSTWPG